MWEQEWFRWVITTVVAAAALVLGIRAEMRNSRYKAQWTMHDDTDEDQGIAINRTGEDARNVRVWFFDMGGSYLAEKHVVADGATVEFFTTRLGNRTHPDRIAIQWERPSTGYTYRQLLQEADERSWWKRNWGAVRAVRSEARKRSLRGHRHRV